MGGQAAGRGERCDHRGGAGQTLGLELVAQHSGEGIAQFLERLGRQLFHKQFDE